MPTIDFKFAIADAVLITAVQRPGRVDGLSVDNNGRMYRVVYWADGDRKAVWMYEWEIIADEARPNTPLGIGFEKEIERGFASAKAWEIIPNSIPTKTP